jgi:hypothetical protein
VVGFYLSEGVDYRKMSTRDTPEPESIDTSETTSPRRTDIQLVADLLTQNGIKVINAVQEDNPHLEVAITKDEIEPIRTLLEEAATEHQYRIITPTDTNSLREWPTSNTEPDQLRTVLITPESGLRFTPEKKGVLRASHL